MADDISRFDPNWTRTIQAVSVADDETSLNLKADPTNNNALYTDATVSSSALPAGAATAANQDLLLTELQLKADLTETQPVQEVEPAGINGGDVVVGLTEVEVTFTGVTRAVMIQSKVSNTGSIWIGPTGVTNIGGNAFVQLSPGQSVSIDFNDITTALYAISDVAAQTIYKVGLI